MSTFEQANVRTSDATEDHLSLASVFDPDTYFREWLAAIEAVRDREPEEPSAGVLLNGNDLDFEGVVSFDDQLAEKLEAPGTLVVAEHGSLHGDVYVTLALINGVFKGNIAATEGVVIENHAVVIGDIYTPMLTIRGGAIIEGKCYFEEPKERWGPPVWSALKGSLARVWRGRIFQ
ncbi:MAG: polymer-forming cytoskeletal protein [Acidobacteriota bacterium]